MFNVLFLLGALIPTYLLSRLFLFILKKTMKYNGYVLANVLSLLLSGAIYGKNIQSQFGENYWVCFFAGILTYFLPQLVWLVRDIWLNRKNAQDKKETAPDKNS